jgi:DNA topoisomerase-1
MEADDVLELLRKRSELKKFVRKIIPPKRGRSHAKVLNSFFEAGIEDIGSLARSDKKKLEKMKLSADEAESLVHEARLVYNKELLKGYGVPAVSLKKYFDAGFITPEDFCYIHPAYLSAKSGLNIDTVYKHTAKVCEATGMKLPEKVSKKELESGRKELLSIEGLGESMLDKLYMAGIVNKEKLCKADPEQTSKLTGIPSGKITYFQEECK